MDFFTGQIMPLAFGFAPRNMAYANGQLLPVNQNQALFALLGKTFGGDGQPGGTFGLPDLRGRTAVGFGNNGSAMPLGANGGEASHALTIAEMPAHVHQAFGATQGNVGNAPDGALPGIADTNVYGAASALVPLGGAPLSTTGGGQPHQNMQPSSSISFCVVLVGVFPVKS